jgi:hypothetical protein
MPTTEYDPAEFYDAHKILTDVSERRFTSPSGYLNNAVARAITIYDMTPGRFSHEWPDAKRPTAQEALASLTVLREMREWAETAEAALIDAARADGSTWEQIAPCLGVADRRAAQTRAARARRRRSNQTTAQKGQQ